MFAILTGTPQAWGLVRNHSAIIESKLLYTKIVHQFIFWGRNTKVEYTTFVT